jgi:hypothetical protein
VNATASATAILEDLRREGVRLWTDGVRLGCRGNKEALTPDVLKKLSVRKQEFIRILRDDEPPEAGAAKKKGVNEQRTDIGSPSPAQRPKKSVTKLRTTNLKPDEKDEKALVLCIHNLAPEACALCSGYVRWLIEDEARISGARHNPEAMRRRYRETLRPEMSESINSGTKESDCNVSGAKRETVNPSHMQEAAKKADPLEPGGDVNAWSPQEALERAREAYAYVARTFPADGDPAVLGEADRRVLEAEENLDMDAYVAALRVLMREARAQAMKRHGAA